MSPTDPPAALDDAPTLAARRLDDLADRVACANSANAAGAGGDRDTADAALDVFAPATAERIGSVPACDTDTVDAAVERAREAQAEWAATPARERAAVLDRFGDLVLDRREELLDLLQVETGKSRRTAVEELFDVPTGCSYVASEAPDAL
ncbi:succinic semialdehyde dehydrogenase, partial [Halorubrum sp. E3]